MSLYRFALCCWGEGFVALKAVFFFFLAYEVASSQSRGELTAICRKRAQSSPEGLGVCTGWLNPTFVSNPDLKEFS